MLKNLNIQPLLIVVFFAAFSGQAIRNLIDWGGYAIAIALLTTFLLLKKSTREIRIPKTGWFLLSSLFLSVLFSSYILWSLLGFAITLITVAASWKIYTVYSWEQITQGLWLALTSTLILSLLFETVTAIYGNPILPLYLIGTENPPGLYYWSTAKLFEGGPIQGIVGNRNLLGFIALLTLAITVLIKNVPNIAKITIGALSFAMILLTQSATITVGLLGSGIVLGTVILMRYWKTKYERTKYLILTFFTGAAVTGAIVLYQPLIALLNREPDMTNRFGIWAKVLTLIQEKPITGWGWLGHWVPSIYPYKGLVVSNGVTHLHAHNAFLDVLLQTGIIGLGAFVLFLGFAGVRIWKLAVDKTQTLTSALPLLLLVCLLVQAVTESRLLLEGNLLLFTLLALHAKNSTTSLKPIVKEITIATGTIKIISPKNKPYEFLMK